MPAGVTALDHARSLVARAQAAATTGSAETSPGASLARPGRTLPTSPAVADLLPAGALRAGAAYAVRGSTALAMTLIAGPTAAGAWCGVVGLPEFGAEAASGLGVNLARLVLVPEPGRDWLAVVAALADALTLVVVRPAGRATTAEVSRLSARLRARGAVLIAVTGPTGIEHPGATSARSWPGAEACLEVGEHTWTGLGDGHGHLTAQQVTVTVTGRGTAVRPHRHRLWLPDPAGAVRTVEQGSGQLAGAPLSGPVWQHEATG